MKLAVCELIKGAVDVDAKLSINHNSGYSNVHCVLHFQKDKSHTL